MRYNIGAYIVLYDKLVSPDCLPIFIHEFTDGINFSDVKSWSLAETVALIGDITFV